MPLLEMLAALVSIVASMVAIVAAIQARKYRDSIFAVQSNAGNIFHNVRSEGNGGDGFRIVNNR